MKAIRSGKYLNQNKSGKRERGKRKKTSGRGRRARVRQMDAEVIAAPVLSPQSGQLSTAGKNKWAERRNTL